MECRIIRKVDNDSLAHAGKKDMKWGYNNGKRNGKRTADESRVPGMSDNYTTRYYKHKGTIYKKYGPDSKYGTYESKTGDQLRVKVSENTLSRGRLIVEDGKNIRVAELGKWNRSIQYGKDAIYKLRMNAVHKQRERQQKRAVRKAATKKKIASFKQSINEIRNA